MQNGQWLYAGLCVGLINGVILWQQWWCVVGILWGVWLIWSKFRTERVWLINMLVLSGIIFGCYGLKWQQLELLPAQTYHGTISVHGDDLKGAGTTVIGVGTLLSGETVRLSWLLQNEETMRWIQKLDKNCLLKVEGELQQIQSPTNRYSFDGKYYWRGRGICRQLRIKHGTVIGTAKLSINQMIIMQIKTWHKKMVLWFETLPSGLRDYGETLLLGYARQSFYTDNTGLTELGILHLFSISGFQVTVIYTGWRWFGQRCLLTREVNLGSMHVVLVFLWLFAGSVQSLIRAILLGFIHAWQELRWLHVSRYDAWGLTVIGGTLIEPGILTQLGGQLSYLLTFGLLWVSQKPTWWQSIYLSLLIVPVLLWHTFIWHPIALVASIIFIPVFTYFIFPIVLIGVLAHLAQISWITSICASIIQYLQHMLGYLGNLPGNLVIGQPPKILCLILLIALIFWLDEARRLRMAWLISINSFIILLWHTLIPIGCVTFFDVGQGDATIIKRPYHSAIMIDVGGKVAFNQPNWAIKKVKNYQVDQLTRYLHAHGISKIDTLFLTHKDQDHIGNLSELLKKIPIKKIVMPLGMIHEKKVKQLGLGQRIIEAQAGMTLSDGKVLHPYQAGRGENEDSLVTFWQVGPKSLVMTGDLDRDGEARIQRTWDIQVDILKFGHHGSKTSSNPSWVEQLKPSYGIVSAGKNNRFGHPHIETLHTAQKMDMTVFNTSDHGMIEYKWLGQKNWWEVQQNGH